MKKIILNYLLGLSLISITGCVSIPKAELSRPIQVEELSNHVHFLSQPALKGRKTKTWGSASARRYLNEQFKACGLVPWSGAENYEQPFGLGTNVIGVLPGSDPDFSDEFVILSAHYDHLGKGKKGIYHGACDNASGVAALLEIAEQLSQNPNQPKRSICFAAFDSEERGLLGSYAFTCRNDFDSSKIAAVINIDMLGRDFLDIVEGSLLVVGTEPYPVLQSQILKLGKERGVKVLPIGADIAGHRSDQVAFQTLGMPVLFFTCGLYGDYHKPTDVAEKINYGQLKKSTLLIGEMVRKFANDKSIESPVLQT